MLSISPGPKRLIKRPMPARVWSVLRTSLLALSLLSWNVSVGISSAQDDNGTSPGIGPKGGDTRPRPPRPGDGTRPPVERPRPPVETPQPPVEQPGEGTGIIDRIKEWWATLPAWLKWLIIIIAVAALVYAAYKYFTRPKAPPDDDDDDDDEDDCVVMIDAIKFNHDPSSRTSDAINIRINYDTPLEAPEWQLFDTVLPKDSPAAYSIADVADTITIKARFAVYPPTVGSASVRARGGGILGPVDETVISFNNGVSVPEFVELKLPKHTIKQGGVKLDDIRWKWEYKCGAQGWTEMTLTLHRIYAVLKNPQGPWFQENYPAETQNPWADVLDFACSWAAGAKDEDTAATMVTQKVNEPAGGVRYDQDSGASHYTDGPKTFKCTEYIGRLNGKKFSEIVNCTDCASFVTTFANILGCELWESTMEANFKINPIIGIGLSAFGPPFHPKPRRDNWRFSYHEVAWKRPAGNEQQLFDACLKVNGNEDPNHPGQPDGSHQTPELPVNAVFYQANGFQYKNKLVDPQSMQYCQPTRKGRRRSVI